MSMQTISSPRFASSGTRRRPMNPVPPRIRMDMRVSSPSARGDGVARSLDRWRGRRNAAAPVSRISRSSLERGAVPLGEVGGGGVGALQEVEQQIGGRGGLANRLVGQDEFA